MMILIELDKAGAEWDVVAYLTGDGNMLAVVESNKSPHTVTGSLISGVPEDIVEKENKIVGNHTDPDTISDLREQLPELDIGQTEFGWFLPRIFSIRQMGKKSNHGLNYDMKYRRFALENEMEEKESKTIVDLYKTKAYPGIPLWHETIRQKLNKDRTLENCFGRKRKFLDAWGPELFDAAYSFIPQSTVFDTTRIGMVKIYQDESKLFKPVEILAQVHDSVVIQYPEDTAAIAEVGRIIGTDYMNPLCQYNAREFHIRTTMKVGRDWGNMIECDWTADAINKALGELDEQAAA
jgi:uncharacterized LabA/DUF88 family protein